MKNFLISLQKLKIYYIELLLAISSKKCLKFFLKKYNLTMKSSYLKYLCDDNIPLIIFNDKAKIYFCDIKDFENGSRFLYGGGGHVFPDAVEYLRDILRYTSKERSIRLLTFSDPDLDCYTFSSNHFK